MWVTIITDASFCPKSGAAGWGHYIISNRGRLIGGGIFKQDVGTSTEAETRAIVNALHLALDKRNAIAEAGDSVLIQSDCMTALTQLESGLTYSGRSSLTDVQRAFNRLIHTTGISVLFRHVRGHTNRQDRRHWTNRMCDMRAREYMAEDRKRRAYA
ncbi:MAG: ribonuclease H family protein [Synergistaceae bacterium]